MENYFIPNENEVIENFRKTNPTAEDYYDTVSESDPEFLRKENQIAKPVLIDADIETQYVQSVRAKEARTKERYDIELPDGYVEIELFDSYKSCTENFETGKTKKYILIEVDKTKHFTVKNPESILPTPQSKCLVDIEKVEEYSSLEFIVIDYDTIFGLRYLTFMKYDSDFLSCDERVMFEALLIKFKAFDYKPFYWSREKIFQEIGIRKDRTAKIVSRFLELGILSSVKNVKSFINNRPGQINYFDLDPYKIIELVPKLFKKIDGVPIESKFKEYFAPVLAKENYSKMQ